MLQKSGTTKQYTKIPGTKKPQNKLKNALFELTETMRKWFGCSCLGHSLKAEVSSAFFLFFL